MEREADLEKYSNLPGKSIALRCLLETLWFPLSGGAGWVLGGGGIQTGTEGLTEEIIRKHYPTTDW